MVYEFTEAELVELIADAMSFGAVIGFFIGMIIAVFLIYVIRFSYNRNFKMWLLEIKEEKRNNIIKEIDTILDSLNEITSNSNSKMFKVTYNRLNKLKSYITQKYIQT